MLFSDFNVSDALLRAVENLGFTAPTEIQARCVPLMLEKKDVVGRSKTGSGKTFAFGIPAVEMIDPEIKNIQAIILCPTRELAIQITDELRKLTFYKHDVGIVPVYGGAGMDKQIQGIKKGKIVVGTPGRVMDHLRRKTLKLNDISLAVLDEADEMLNMGFREDIEFILKRTPKSRQTAMFSATMPPAIKSLAANYLVDAVHIENENTHTVVDEINETYIRVAHYGKRLALLELFDKLQPQSAIVFCNTKRMTDALARHLKEKGVSAEPLHGDMRQSERRRVMDKMKKHEISVLVATDVAARGIDIENVDYIFNFDIPADPESYTHRIGRTGRAGKKGTSIAFVSDADSMTRLMDTKDARNAEITEHPLSAELTTFQEIEYKKAAPKSAMYGKAEYQTKSKTQAFIPFMKRKRW